MVSATRTKTGTISRPKYDLGTLRLIGERNTSIAKARTSPRKKKQFQRKLGRTAGQEAIKTVSETEHLDIPAMESAISAGAIPPAMDATRGLDFNPPVAFGTFEQIELSVIQRADRKIEDWEKIRAAHVEHHPNAVPMIDWQLEDARAERAKLEDNEDNNRVGNPKAGEQRISRRIEVLEQTLAESKFEPEAENIRGAIAAYKSGQIQYSRQYTLIWAGKVVDQAATYADFTRDRLERLDGYAKQYGPHWLWWESPLDLKPHERPQMNLGAPLPREDLPSGLGAWYVNQAFLKRSEWVMRLPTTASYAIHPLEDRKSPTGKVYCQSEGPKLVYRSVLDSGASCPCLWPPDLKALGVDLLNYGAQSVDEIATANGYVVSRCYELHVSVLDDNLNGLVDANNAVWPWHGKFLGSLCPVWMLRGPEEYGPNGEVPNVRLSGILPFLACYTASAPTRNIMTLGEDRNDVMGGHKTPGQKRWEITMPSAPPAQGPTWDRYGDPKITFSHKNGMIIDTDVPDMDHVSKTIFYQGTPQEQTVWNNPKEQHLELMRNKQLEEQLAYPRAFAGMDNLRLE